MLSIEQREHLKQYREQRNQAEKKGDTAAFANFRQMNQRIRDRALKAIEDLKFIAETMPDDQLEQIFTFETLKPFLESLTSPELTITKNSKNEKLHNRRVFEICFLMEELGVRNGYAQISDEFKKLFMDTTSYRHAVFPVRSVGLWEVTKKID